MADVEGYDGIKMIYKGFFFTYSLKELIIYHVQEKENKVRRNI